MKNLVIIFLFVFFPFISRSYTWQSFCPDTIHANNICFGVGSWKGVICSPGGMYLWEEDIEQWTFYTYGLPVNGAAWLDGNKILVVMGNGSWSDGIYTFDLTTHQFEVVEWVVTPNFILVVPVLDQKTNLFTDEYHVGSQFGGLYRSIDGLTWTEVPYFYGKSCTAMDFYGEHLVVSEVSNIINIHCSDDYGATWHEAASSTLITDLKFNNAGELYGIFPGYSNSSGLYKSEDFGNNWEVEFWSDNMSSVGFDAMGTIFVGWDSLAGGNEGIAIYNPQAPPPGLTFLNNGLTSTHINKILMNPAMSAIAIFCCTDSGVYMCNDYMVGENEVCETVRQPEIYPNPLSERENLIVKTHENEQIRSIDIFSAEGKITWKTVLSMNTARNVFECNPPELKTGTYLVRVKTDRGGITKILLVR
jgi:hypothetical protein